MFTDLINSAASRNPASPESGKLSFHEFMGLYEQFEQYEKSLKDLGEKIAVGIICNEIGYFMMKSQCDEVAKDCEVSASILNKFCGIPVWVFSEADNYQVYYDMKVLKHDLEIYQNLRKLRESQATEFQELKRKLNHVTPIQKGT